MSLKARIEAVLFLTDKPLAAAAIAQLVNVDVQEVRQTILELIHDYEERNSALEIADDGGYMMQAKDEYATFANDLAPIDLSVSIVRTLSAIAIKQPVLQSEIVRIRGAGAYDHIKELLEKELITKKEEGRSALLGTTKKFQEYFRLSQDARALRDELKQQTKTESEISGEPTDSEAALINLTDFDSAITPESLIQEPVTQESAVEELAVEKLAVGASAVEEPIAEEPISENNSQILEDTSVDTAPPNIEDEVTLPTNDIEFAPSST